MERLTRTLAGLMRWLALVLPDERRQWADALIAETHLVPAGRQRLRWLAGGLVLVIREGHMARKFGYWLGACAIAAAAAWAIWLSWRTSASADAEAMTDRVRIGVGVAALAGLPWLGRKRSWFGPVSDAITARAVRLLGCGAVCTAGIWLVRADRNAGRNGIGDGRFNWFEEFAGLVLLGAVVAAPPLVAKWWPRVDAELLRAIPVLAGTCAFVVMPIQALFVGYIAGIMAATAKRSAVSITALAIGTSLGVVAGGLMYGAGNVFSSDSYAFLLLMVVFPAINIGLAVVGGGAAASRVTGAGDPQELRKARIRQGAYAGMIVGAVAGLLLELVFVGLGIMMVAGPLAGLGGGMFGAALVADRARQPRSEGLKAAGLFVADS